MALKPYEQLPMLNLITPDNDNLGRVLKVFAALGNEIRELENTATTRFYPFIALFGKAIKPTDPNDLPPMPPGTSADKIATLRNQLKNLNDSELAVEVCGWRHYNEPFSGPSLPRRKGRRWNGVAA